MTNLLQCVILVRLVTNTFIEWPSRTVPLPCPDGMAGCLVYHAKIEPDTSAKERTRVTEIREISDLKVLGVSVEVSNVLKSRIAVPQYQVVEWRDNPAGTNDTANANVSISTLTNVTLFTGQTLSFTNNSLLWVPTK